MTKSLYKFFLPALILISISGSYSSYALTDTLHVMAYNVLNYGEYPLCQGPNSIYNSYLETIVAYANPDILGLEKMGSIQTSSTDLSYSAAIGFQDSILQFALNAAYPGRYNYCTFTNVAGSSDFSMLFYNQQKLGFITITCNYASTEDFNTYKFYYKDPYLATTHDTTFLYVTLNHDISGDGNETQRGYQIAGEMDQIQTHFSHLANMINMGDFNVRNSSEICYQRLTNPTDTNYRYYDPPFYPDAHVSYPADWDSDPVSFAKYLTTSTRESGSVPNSCGTSGGAKDWYDHIFLSPWIINNANYIHYIPNSFRVIGNDGNRVSVSVNSTPPTNTSAPAPVINALFQMSNKYPVMVDLAVTPDSAGISPVDPEGLKESVSTQALRNEHISFVNPAGDYLKCGFSSGLIGQTVNLECTDMLGRQVMNQIFTVDNDVMQIPFDVKPGAYILRVTGNNNLLCQNMIIKN